MRNHLVSHLLSQTGGLFCGIDLYILDSSCYARYHKRIKEIGNKKSRILAMSDSK